MAEVESPNYRGAGTSTLPRREERGSSPARRILVRVLLVALILAAPFWAGDGATVGPRLNRGLQVVTREYAFSLTRWEAEALSTATLHALGPAWTPGRDPTADRQIVERYTWLTGELARLQRERDEVEATQSEPTRDQRREELSRQAQALAAERRSLTGPVEAIVAWQVERVLAEQGIRRGLLELSTQSAFPYFSARVTPGVAFHLGPTPNLLVVAPRDRIAVAGTILLDPDLSYEQVDRVEASADRVGGSSVVTPIGGLATYPTMVPASSSVRGILRTICHEWAHHYLAFRPLGQAFFGDYRMRTINETAADLVGDELSGLVYNRFYAQAERRAPDSAPDARPTRPAFGDLMREIRSEVERYLTRGDVAGAEAYMAEQRGELAKNGYYVRRLNTAYLSFFGAYSGSANPYEAKLQAVRRNAGSLRVFLDAVAGVTSPSDLDRLPESNHVTS